MAARARAVYPASEIYHFKPLDERVEVYSKPFRLRAGRDAARDAGSAEAAGAMQTVTITGALEYQACDDKVCFNPARVPISFEISLNTLDRRPPGNQ